MKIVTWLLTTTTYGTWLPGDKRGFVSRVRDRRDDDPNTPSRVTHNRPNTDYDRDSERLQESAKKLLQGQAVWLTPEQANVVCRQLPETAQYRNWRLFSASVMSNHMHLVVECDRDVMSEELLRDFKSYASRALNQRWARPVSGTWWTSSGSTRVMPDERAVNSAIHYVLNQYKMLAVYDGRISERPA